LLHVFLQGGAEFFPRRKAETARQSLKRFGIFRDGMSLLFGLDLETVLDPTEESVGVFQGASFGAWQQFQFGQDG
jgi:hypothetical protein